MGENVAAAAAAEVACDGGGDDAEVAAVAAAAAPHLAPDQAPQDELVRCAWHCHVVSSSAVSKLSMFVPSHDVQPSVPTLTVRWLPPARSARSLTCATQRR